ncbi:MAG: MMPL family transporter [Acidobacteriota bacterium]|nr:MMPL family transporter [Acidobacteriota bacterium]MDQ7088570.1 MMPL family transporter [Acidobacteriota bacterium]
MSAPGRRRGGLRGVLRRGLEAVAWFSVFHPRSVLVGVAIATAVAGYLAADLRLSTDIDSLIPDDVHTAQRMRELFRRYGGAEPIVAAISGKGEEDLDDRTELALALRDRLEECENVQVVAGIFGEDPWALLSGSQARSLMLYLDPQQLDSLAGQLTPEAIDARVAANRERLLSPLGPLTTRLLREDPLGLSGFLVSRLAELKGELRVMPRSGMLVTEDGSYVLLLIRPEGAAHDLRFARQVLAEVAGAARLALEDMEMEGTVGLGPADEPGGIHVGLTGAPAVLVDYQEILSRDIRSISVVAFVAVLVLFLFAFRRMVGVLVAGVPLLVGLTWSLGFAYLAIGEINVFTAGSVAMLCGLGIDFTIHLYNRYLEETHAGKDMFTAFAAAHGETGLGILSAALTTAWAFLAAGFSRFQGLRHLGLICAAGIALSLVAALLLVPALTALATRWRPGPDRPRGLAGFGLGPILRGVLRHPGWVAGTGLVVTVALVWPTLSVRLDEDFRRFRPTGAPSIRLQLDISRQVGTSLQPVAALVPGESDAEILEASAAVEEQFRRLIGDGESSLAVVVGPASVVPPPSHQQAVLQRLRELRAAGKIRPAAVETDLLAAMERHGFRVDGQARRAAARIRRMLEVDGELTLERAESGMLADVLSDLIVEAGDGSREGLVIAYPRPNARSRDLVEALQQAVKASGHRADLVGGRVLSQELKPLILRDGVMAVALTVVGVLLILFLTFRRPLLVLLTFLPLVVGVVGSVGLMHLFGIDFNLVSISMVPLILGIGIDNGIHVVHRFLEHSAEDLAEVFEHTGRGIVMTSLTTMVGFGALIFADYPGLIASGFLAILGVGATLVTAVTLLPAMLRLTHVR